MDLDSNCIELKSLALEERDKYRKLMVRKTESDELLQKMREEIEVLESRNKKLELELHAREEVLQSLFSFIETSNKA